MLPLKNILCGTDFSQTAAEAVKVAVELARQHFARIHLVHVVPPVPMYLPAPGGRTTFNPSQYQEQMEEQGNRSLRNLARDKIPESVEKSLIVCRGPTARTLIQMAREIDTELIVVGAHGVNCWSRALLGSVASKVVRLAHCPVLVVRRKEKPNTR